MLMCDYVPAAWLRVAVWICLGSRRTSTVKNTHTQRHTRCPFPLGLHHIRGMFAEGILCADRTLRNRLVHTQAASHIHTESLLSSLNLGLHTTKLAWREKRDCWVDTKPQVSHKQ